VKQGAPLRKYNQVIGFATGDLAPGTHIHTHNCVMAISSATTPSAPTPIRRTLSPRPSAPPFRAIAAPTAAPPHATISHRHHGELLGRDQPHDRPPYRAAARPVSNIDGVVPLTHGGGCGMAALGLEMDVLRRTLPVTRAIPTWRQSSCWGWVARPTRSRA